MSNPSTQISPIPPESYGERFVNFITGITMTKEEAERRTTMEIDDRGSLDAHNMLHHHHLPSPIITNLDGANSNEKYSPMSPLSSSPIAVDKTMQRAQKQADKSTGSKSRRESEEEVPDRTLRTTTIHDGEVREGRNSTTLPVLEEVGEISDTSRSASREQPHASVMKHTGIRKSSTSKSRRLSEEQEKEQFYTPQLPQEIFHSPVEYPESTRSAVNNAFRPINSDELSSADSPGGIKRDKPPRLGSGLIPHLEPMYASLDAIGSEHDISTEHRYLDTTPHAM